MLHFHAGPIWERFLHDPHLSVFTAVPTIYAKLLEHAQSFDEDKKRFVKERMKRIRLMMSGSAALPGMRSSHRSTVLPPLLRTLLPSMGGAHRPSPPRALWDDRDRYGADESLQARE